MKQPVARDVAIAQPEPMPLPRFMPRRLTAPDQRFVNELVRCIQGGGYVETSALHLAGISRKEWRRWKQRTDGLYGQMRDAVRAALLDAEMLVRARQAERSPGAVLKELRRTRSLESEPEPTSRPYHSSGLYRLKRQLPHVLDRIRDDTVPADALSPLEVAARDWRAGVLIDLGGRDALTTSKLALINAALGSWLLLSSVDAYLFELAGTSGVVNRRTRSAFAIVEQRARLADSFVRQLQALGLEKRSTPPMDLSTYIAQKYGTSDGTPGPVKEDP
jgi:hypothetical protein